MWFVIIAIVLIIFILMYNQLVREGKQADNSFSTVNVLLKKRYDLIPNLVNTVKGYAMHEKEVFEKVTLLRDEAISQKSHDEIVKLDNGISSGIKDIFAVAEAYPELMASENFLALQKSLEKMEDELLAARRTYNAAVTEYNISLDSFPTNLVGKIFNPLLGFKMEFHPKSFIFIINKTISMASKAVHMSITCWNSPITH